MELNEALKTLKSEGFVAEGFFGNAYTRYKAKVLAALKDIGVIVHDQQKLEAWIRDFFVDRCDVEDCIQSCRENIKSFGKRAPVAEAFMQDDRGSVTEEEIANAIVAKVGADGNKYYLDAARYIAAFYVRQSMPKNGMVMWGSRDLKSFVARQEKDVKSAIASTRSVMLGNPETKAEWIEKNKQEIRRERAEAEEKRRQDYLASDEYKRSQDPGWRGPNGTWSND